MFHTTRAIALRTFRHGDRSIVLKAYTEAFGARSYMIRSSARGSWLRPQPMDRMEVVVTEGDRHDMQVIREWRVAHPYLQVHSDHARGLLLLFAQEVFSRTLREETADADLFRFVLRSLEDIDTGQDLTSFPLFLLLGLARNLGFTLGIPDIGDQCFDLREGRFFSGPPMHALCMDRETSRALQELLRAEEHNTPVHLGSASRRALLEQLLTYFRLHVDGFGQLRSLEVLRALLH